MKKVIFLMLFSVFTSVGIFAQSANGSVGFSTGQQGQDPTTDQKAKDETDKLNNIVQLSSDQYPKALQINRNFFYQVRSMSSVTTKGQSKAAYGREQQLKSILTSDQINLLQAAKSNGQW
jgi:hypothetical protein